MARTHARVLCAIWNDPDWVALDFGPQWLYQELLSQSSLNHAGVIGLTVRRWARGAANMDVATLEKFLSELVEHRFVVVDEETEELLVRSLIRRDGIAEQPNLLKAALNEARQIASPLLRAVLADELRRLPKKRPDTARMIYPDPHAVADEIDPGPVDRPPSGKSFDNPSGKPFDKASHDPWSDAPDQHEPVSSGGVQQTLLGTLPETHGETPGGRGRGRGIPHLPSDSSQKTHTATSSKLEELMIGFVEFYAAFPKRKDRLKAEKAWRAARRKGVLAEHMIEAAKRYSVETRDREARYIALPASWLNAGSYDNEPEPERHLRAVSGGYRPWRNPVDDSEYDQPLLDPIYPEGT